MSAFKVPPKLTLPSQLNDTVHMRLAAQTREGRELLHTFAGKLEQIIEVETHNLATSQEALRLVREALGEVAA